MTTYTLPENLIVRCGDDYLAEVRAFADRTNQREQLEEQLASLPKWFGGQAFAQLYSDFAPYSFYWVLTSDREGKQVIMNGGLIYHGAHDRGGDGGAPTFSVNLMPSNGWRIHT